MPGKVIVITGASSGIGAALARRLGADGHALVLSARRQKELKQVAAQSGSNAVPVVTDVTHRKDVEKLRDVAIEKFGRVDVWVNNAGQGIGKKVMEITDDDLDKMLAVNLKSVLYGMQAIVPHFQHRGEGHIINVSTFLGRVPLITFRSAYSAAKSAMNTLTTNLRMDLKQTHPKIEVSLVLPGVVATEFGAHALGGTPTPVAAGGSVKVQTAEEVADQIATLIEHPMPELYTLPDQAGLVTRYYQDVGAFEERLRQRSARTS